MNPSPPQPLPQPPPAQEGWTFFDSGCTLTGAHTATMTEIRRRAPAQDGWSPSIEFVFTVDCGTSAGAVVSRRLPESFSKSGDLYKFMAGVHGGDPPPATQPTALIGRRFSVLMELRKDDQTRVASATPAAQGSLHADPTIGVTLVEGMQEIMDGPGTPPPSGIYGGTNHGWGLDKIRARDPG